MGDLSHRIPYGIHLSVPECELWGSPERRALGLFVSAPRQCFPGPSRQGASLQRRKSSLATAPSAPVCTVQQLASWLVSMLPAVPPQAVPAAPVHLRDVFSWVSTALQEGHSDIPLGLNRAHVFRLFESDRVLEIPRPGRGSESPTCTSGAFD